MAALWCCFHVMIRQNQTVMQWPYCHMAVARRGFTGCRPGKVRARSASIRAAQRFSLSALSGLRRLQRIHLRAVDASDDGGSEGHEAQNGNGGVDEGERCAARPPPAITERFSMISDVEQG
jgi:hypothetical protein